MVCGGPAREMDNGSEAVMWESYDVVVIGGGAAGLSAAMVLGRARRRVAVVDAGAPRNAPAAHMRGFLSRDGMPPNDLLTAGRTEVASYGVDVTQGRVLGVDAGFSVRLADGNVLPCRSILLATGVEDVLPDIPGISERWGRDLLHCPYCHGWEVRDQPIAVLGTQAASVAHALLVRQWSEDIVFFAHTSDVDPEQRGLLDARGIRILDGEVIGLVIDDDRLQGVELRDGRIIPRSAVFIRPRNVPHADGLLAGLGCALDDEGFPKVDASGRTTTAGVWAAGNVVDPMAVVVNAASAGVKAAAMVNMDLIEEDLAAQLERRSVSSV